MAKTQTRHMEVTTFEGYRFVILFDRTADNCYSCRFPDTWETYVQDAAKYHDTWSPVNDGGIVFYCGSLSRLLDLIADFIGRTEL